MSSTTATTVEENLPIGRGSASKPRSLGEALRGEKVKVALNGTVLADKTALAARDGDEIALLPPVSGG